MTDQTAPLGSSAHQALIAHVVAHYADDERIRAVAVFGSVGAGTWHELSDVHSDMVTEDGAQVDPGAEITALFGSRAVIVLAGADEADVVLDSREELSVRWHPRSGRTTTSARGDVPCSATYPPAARNAASISGRLAPLASRTCRRSRAFTGSRTPAPSRPAPSRSRSEPANP